MYEDIKRDLTILDNVNCVKRVDNNYVQLYINSERYSNKLNYFTYKERVSMFELNLSRMLDTNGNNLTDTLMVRKKRQVVMVLLKFLSYTGVAKFKAKAIVERMERDLGVSCHVNTIYKTMELLKQTNQFVFAYTERNLYVVIDKLHVNYKKAMKNILNIDEEEAIKERSTLVLGDIEQYREIYRYKKKNKITAETALIDYLTYLDKERAEVFEQAVKEKQSQTHDNEATANEPVMVDTVTLEAVATELLERNKAYIKSIGNEDILYFYENCMNSITSEAEEKEKSVPLFYYDTAMIATYSILEHCKGRLPSPVEVSVGSMVLRDLQSERMYCVTVGQFKRDYDIQLKKVLKRYVKALNLYEGKVSYGSMKGLYGMKKKPSKQLMAKDVTVAMYCKESTKLKGTGIENITDVISFENFMLGYQNDEAATKNSK